MNYTTHKFELDELRNTLWQMRENATQELTKNSMLTDREHYNLSATLARTASALEHVEHLQTHLARLQELQS